MATTLQTKAGLKTATRTHATDQRIQDRAPPKILQDLIAPTSVRFNGDQPWDIRIRDSAVYSWLLREGSLGFGEAYMDGAWDSERLDETVARLLSRDTDRAFHSVARLRFALTRLREVLFNHQTRARAFEVGEHHYDIGNEIYRAMLDSTMSYSCGYWEEAENLEQAQQAKLEMIARKLKLEPGQRVLDIGCGWGGLSHHLASRHGVEVLGVTVSGAQQRLAQERCAGLPVDVRLMDYRDIPKGFGERFDRIVSVGMFEHVGPKNYMAYFSTAQRLLRDEGIFLLHTIGSDRSMPTPDPWIDKYIFPNGRIPSAQQIARAIEHFFLIEDWHNFGQDYDRTLMAWWDNFDAAWPSLRGGRYDQRFYRMWKFYLQACAGMFRARHGQLWQIVLTQRTHRGTYRSVR